MSTDINDEGVGMNNFWSGAKTGGSTGSAFGPVGMGVGAVVGGFGNMWSNGGLTGSGGGGDEAETKKLLMEYYNRVNGRETPQMGTAAQGGRSAFRSNQAALISRLEAMSRGEGPSLANEQFKANTDRLGAQQSSIANSGRGGPLAAQSAANNTALIGAQASQGAAMGRIQEQYNATNQLGLTIHGARGADEDMNRFNAGQQNERSQANLAARLKTMGMNDEAILRILAQLGGKAYNEASRPSERDALMAGTAGAISQYTTQQAQQRAYQQQQDKQNGFQLSAQDQAAKHY